MSSRSLCRAAPTNELRREIALEAGKTSQLNVQLVQTTNGDHPGRRSGQAREDHAEACESCHPGPRSAQRQWKAGLVGRLGGNRRPISGRAAGIALGRRVDQRAMRRTTEKTLLTTIALPGPPPVPGSRARLLSRSLSRLPSLLLIFSRIAQAFVRYFWMDGGHPSNWDPTWMGHSIGKWEGDVLVDRHHRL